MFVHDVLSSIEAGLHINEEAFQSCSWVVVMVLSWCIFLGVLTV